MYLRLGAGWLSCTCPPKEAAGKHGARPARRRPAAGGRWRAGAARRHLAAWPVRWAGRPSWAPCAGPPREAAEVAGGHQEGALPAGRGAHAGPAADADAWPLRGAVARACRPYAHPCRARARPCRPYTRPCRACAFPAAPCPRRRCPCPCLCPRPGRPRLPPARCASRLPASHPDRPALHLGTVAVPLREPVWLIAGCRAAAPRSYPYAFIPGTCRAAARTLCQARMAAAEARPWHQGRRRLGAGCWPAWRSGAQGAATGGARQER